MAAGEKRLFSLINATVSHEMRNPINSISSHVHEQQSLNLKFRSIVYNLTSANYKTCKRELLRNLERQENLTSM